MPLLSNFAAASARSFGMLSSGIFSTWNPLAKSVNLTLSSSNLTATLTGSGGAAGVRATRGKTTGKYHFEITPSLDPSTPNFFVRLGVSNGSESLGAILAVSGTDSVGYAADGSVNINGNQVASTTGWGTGSVIAVEVDFGASLIYFQVFGHARTSGISIAGLSAGPYFPAVNAFTVNDAYTANFGASPFTIAATAGFLPWNAS